MKRQYLYALLLFLLGLSGCMMGPNFTKPVTQNPAGFRFDTSDNNDEVNLLWWELFEDEVLDTLVKKALLNNKDVRIAASRLESAKINIAYTKADQWPAFHYGAGVSASGFSGNTSSSFNVYPQVGWEIGFWGKYRRLNEAAQATYLAGEFAQQTVKLGIVSAVVSTYYSILASQDQLQIASNTVASRDSGLIIMRDKYEGGLISLMDYNQAKIQRDVAATIVPVYKRIIANYENALSILIGEAPHEIEKGKPFYQHKYQLDIPVGIPSELLTRRPDIQQSEALYRVSTAQIGVAEALRWPSLSLTGLMGVASSDLTSLNAMGLTWSAGGSLFGPIFQYGKNKARVELARQDAQVALLQYEQTVLNAFKEVEDALVNISTYEEELIAQESRTSTAMESEELAYVRYEEGSTTYLEVLEQQRQSFSAQLDLLANRLNILNSYILLYKALGGGWLSPEEQQVFLNNQE
ncbi:efflux transporter outer membrane subunit [Maribellus mangrovi]|uniref:efflux transporter outer membrane subunit n=1 Tax=Maribellus mangrovi TaxID=3133146 RepID=UPI0030EF3814